LPSTASLPEKGTGGAPTQKQLSKKERRKRRDFFGMVDKKCGAN